jgi:hypothetical protein
MNEEDNLLSCDATATGILQCLRMLAEEAASLHLTRTLTALRDAIETCVSERTGETGFEIDIDTVVQGLVRVIH